MVVTWGQSGSRWHWLCALVAEHNAQVIYATHSPMVAALPGAQILEMTERGITERKWAELESVALWKRFLGRPDTFFDDAY